MIPHRSAEGVRAEKRSALEKCVLFVSLRALRSAPACGSAVMTLLTPGSRPGLSSAALTKQSAISNQHSAFSANRTAAFGSRPRTLNQQRNLAPEYSQCSSRLTAKEGVLSSIYRWLICRSPKLSTLGAYRPVISPETWQEQWEVTADDEITREHFDKLVLIEALVEGLTEPFEMGEFGQMRIQTAVSTQH